jgi:ATP-dependent Lhr-like helicase
LERHGVLTREAVLAEDTPGGFTGVYGILKALEDRGQVRRGYFVAGLGAAQFALPGAVDRLRSHREFQDNELVTILAATDPAQPFGAALSWPESSGRPARSSGAVVVAAAGIPLVWLDRAGHHLVTFPSVLHDTRWVDALVASVSAGAWTSLEIRKVDGVSVRDSPVGDLLRSAGFADGYKGLVLRRRSESIAQRPALSVVTGRSQGRA